MDQWENLRMRNKVCMRRRTVFTKKSLSSKKSGKRQDDRISRKTVDQGEKRAPTQKRVNK